MYYLFSFATAVLVAVMIVPNGKLTGISGLFAATVIIHLVGLILTSCIAAIQKEPVFRQRKLPGSLFLGGAIGVATTMFNNMAYGHISVASIVALGLVGQTVTSLFIDQFGLFGLPVKRLNRAKLVGILFTTVGAGWMLFGSDFPLFPVVISLLTGVSVVTSRCVNAQLAEKTSVLVSTWYNYAIGLTVSLAILLVAVGTGAMALPVSLSHRADIYLGGAIGVCVVALLNVVTPKLPAFHLTLILFAGQVFTGIVLDMLLTGTFSESNLVGGILVAVGLSLNAWLDGRKCRPEKAADRDTGVPKR